MVIEYVNIPITGFDVEMFKDVVVNNGIVTWVFETSEGRDLEVRLMSLEEYEKREK